MTFESLRLAAPLLRAIAAEGYSTPTPIQAEAIPHVLEGRDLLGCAQTGTGKTAAFALPILHRLASDPVQQVKGARSRLRALVLCPTRELAVQIAESFSTYGRHLPLRHTAVYGGVNQHHQVKALQRGVDILIATPGRLMDLMGQGFVNLRALEALVLDEADRMLDMGFMPDIRKIVSQLPPQRQTLLFSATMPPDIRALANTILRDPASVQVNPVASTVKTIAQQVYLVPRKNKPELLSQLLRGAAYGRTLVFTRTKHGADRVVKTLRRDGFPAEAIHGNKSQNARMRALASFKSRKPPVLVATDIASRGIDVDEISHVINFDMPIDPETYVHRIGRTARAGASGVAITFCDPDERRMLNTIQRITGATIEVNTDQPTYAAAAGDFQPELSEQPAPRASSGKSQKTRQKTRHPARKPARAGDTRGATGSAKPRRASRGVEQVNAEQPRMRKEHGPKRSAGNAAASGSSDRSANHSSKRSRSGSTGSRAAAPARSPKQHRGKQSNRGRNRSMGAAKR